MPAPPSCDALLQKIAGLEAQNRTLSLFKASLHAARESMALLNIEGKFVAVNESFAAGLGYSREELLGMEAVKLKPKRLQAEFKQGFALIKEQGHFSLATTYLQKDGTPIACEMSATLVQFGKESVIHVVVKDATKRNGRECLQRRFENILSLSKDLIAYVDTDYIYQFVNEHFCQSQGKQQDQIIGSSIAEIVGEEPFLQIIQPQIDHCLGGNIVRYQDWITCKSSGRRFKAVTYYPDRTVHGHIQGVFAIIHDLTDSKLVQEVKDAEQALLSHVLDSIGGGVYLVSRDHAILYSNSHLEKTRGPVNNRNCYEYIFNRKAPCPWCKNSLLFSNEEPIHWLHQDNKTDRVYDVFESMVELPKGGKAKITFFHDVSTSKRAQEELLSHNMLLSALVENTTSIIYVKDLEGRYLFANKRFEELFNSFGSIAGKTDFDCFPKKDAEQFLENDKEVVATGEVCSFEETLFYEGVERTYISVKFPIVDSEGVCYAVGGITTDITIQKSIEQVLADKNEQLLSLINATPDSICFKDGKGRWLLANEANLKLFELIDVNYVGKTDAQLSRYSDFYRDAFLTCQDTDELAWKQKVLLHGIEKIPMSDGRVKIFDVIKVPLFHQDGSRKGLLVIGRDISELIDSIEEIRVKSKEVQEANIALRVLVDQQKNIVEQTGQNLLANLRHTVLPYVELLSRTDLDDISREYLQLITVHLQEITNSFVKTLGDPSIGLSPKELLVADLVKQGKSSADISRLLGLTQRTVEVYRNIIRKKLRISGKKINLQRYLNEKFS
ncbi:PAS domain S-box [Desulfocapsa sulfexigens DSM 10523]|uniref:PAS domain S-box n=1 Tax=Desulfocapsa sulfexigens (strain DSM 10523 / SB164P1) TaxID=1167006 RepID=M1PE31_DESSD|nr:PAS domain-containing protein [Desulfocapsa sulfexigens]AGF77955.1 PAS domain S-box [Desulfocapsa sulfexigens DSM 10523]